MNHLFITGTDTGIGKTYATCALLHALHLKFPNRRIAALKPIAAGTDASGRNEDIEHLRAAATVALPDDITTPYLFAPPIAPHLAAHSAGVQISIQKIVQQFTAAANTADHLLVEGVGGFRVPLSVPLGGSPGFADTADLSVALNLPLILVVGLRLGCLNHALLTSEAIERRGLTLAGWIANSIDPSMSMIDANVDSLRNLLRAPLIGHFPHDPIQNPKNAARYLRLDAIGLSGA